MVNSVRKSPLDHWVKVPFISPEPPSISFEARLKIKPLMNLTKILHKIRNSHMRKAKKVTSRSVTYWGFFLSNCENYN